MKTIERGWMVIRGSRVMAAMLIAACMLAPQALAEKAWLTYAKPVYSTDWSEISGPWGNKGADLYKQIDSASANVIWPESAVFYTNPSPTSHDETWWDTGSRTRSFQVYLYNGSDTNFLTTNRLKITLYKSDGTQIDENTKWTDTGTGSDTANDLINDSSTAPLAWSNADNCFYVELDARESITIGSSYNTYKLFNDPSDGECSNVSICVEQSNANLPFEASMCGWDDHHFRTGQGITSAAFEADYSEYFSWACEASYESALSGQSNTIVLPFFREKHSTTTTVAEWTTLIRVVNASSSTEKLVIEVCRQDGTTIRKYGDDAGENLTSLASHAAYLFSPSMFFSSSATQDEAGMVKITGTKPVATALHMRFPKTDHTAGGTEKSRQFTVSVMPFFTY